MQSYLGGQPVTLTIPLIVEGGLTAIDATSVDYRITNQDDVELVAKTSVTSFSAGDAEVSITITALENTLSGVSRELRVVELYATSVEGVNKITVEYVVDPESILVVGLNSFQTYSASLMTGYELPNIDGWNTASKNDKINAAIAAWRSFKRVSLRYVDPSLGGTDMTRLVTPPDYAYYDITLLSAVQYQTLPLDMRSAVSRAQIFEADYLLGGDAQEDLRRSGVMSSTVGESSQFFRTSKPYEGPMCKRALNELSRFIIHGKRIGRS